MEEWIASIDACSGLLVPILTAWAIGCVRITREDGMGVCELIYFATLLLVAVLTVRTVVADDLCWLIHTASLGSLIVAGAMPRSATGAKSEPLFGEERWVEFGNR